jgi:hypothetical protein
VRLEERLGYVHKGINGLMVGADLVTAAKLACRVSGDSTVAYACAFARAVEAATGIAAPPRAAYLRALMAELERLANHFGDIGAICNDAAFAVMLAHCGVLREKVLRFADTAFGHRLMMDCIGPGGVAADLTQEAADALRHLIRDLRTAFAPLIELYDRTASLQDRTVGTGVLRKDLASRFAQTNQEENDAQENDLGARPDEIFGDLADAQSAMPHRDYQRAEIMDGADEQRAEYNPKHAGEPTPNDGYGRPEHGGQAGDRGVVMPKQNSLAAGHVVDAVGHRVRRSRPIGVQLENARA